jgi:hypothetical protein
MPSDRKIAANRENSQRSTGPRTALAKKRIRRNALRHGLAAAIVNASGMPAETTRLARAICGSDAGPAQREQAEIIAQCELLLLRVRAARVEIFEKIFIESASATIGRTTRIFASTRWHTLPRAINEIGTL